MEAYFVFMLAVFLTVLVCITVLGLVLLIRDVYKEW